MIGSPTNPVSAFRMLDYYLYSTDDEYAYGLFNYQFRRFALTQFDYFRRQGIRENVIFNTLAQSSMLINMRRSGMGSTIFFAYCVLNLSPHGRIIRIRTLRYE